MPVPAAEAYVRRPPRINIDVLYFFTVRIKHRYAFPRQINIALVIDSHTVRTHRAKQLLVGQHCVFVDIVSISLLVADVGDVQMFTIGGADDAVGLDQVVGYTDQLLPIRREVIDVLAVLLHWPPVPVRSFIKGVGKIYTAFKVYPQVVRAVQLLAFVVSNQHRYLALHINRP